MMLEILSAINLSFWREAGVMLLLLVTIALMVHKKEKRVIYKKVALWVFPVSLGLSFVAFGEAIISSNRFYQTEFSYACNFAAGSSAVLLSSLIWRKMKELDLERTSSYTAQALYSFSIFCSIIGPINQLWVRPIVLLFGICLYYYFYKRIELKWIPFFISITTLFSYFSIVHSFSMVFPFNHSVNSLIFSTSAVLLMILAYGCRKKDPLLSKAFAWVGHGIYPFALAFTWFEYNTVSGLSFFLSIITYALSTRIVITEWKIKAFLYGCFTSVLFFVSTGLNYLVVQYFGHYEFPITSALILFFWLFANQTFKKRTSFYAVPFSIIGIGTMLFTYPFEFMSYGVTIVYAAVILFYLHKLKWDIIGIIPLFFAFLAMVEFSFFGNKSGFEKLLLSGGIGISMILIGQLVYKKLFNNGRSFKGFKLDGFTFIAFLYFLFMYYFEGTSIWSHALPGIMIAASIWLQRKRVPSNYSVLFQLLSGAYLLQPYYSIISEFQVPHLWKGELLALPWVLLMIFIRLLLQERFSIITKPLEWGILIIVSLFLIHDGLTNTSVYEGIILGSLSLLSMLSGMYWQIKSYFFTGSGVLLLNLFLQTRPYWGHMPWWGYLLVAGFILIIVASSNEWHKQKTLKGESTFITVLKTKVVNKIKKWN